MRLLFGDGWTLCNGLPTPSGSPNLALKGMSGRDIKWLVEKEKKDHEQWEQSAMWRRQDKLYSRSWEVCSRIHSVAILPPHIVHRHHHHHRWGVEACCAVGDSLQVCYSSHPHGFCALMLSMSLLTHHYRLISPAPPHLSCYRHTSLLLVLSLDQAGRGSRTTGVSR